MTKSADPKLDEYATRGNPIAEDNNAVGPRKPRKDRQGFLPLKTNTFDRVFISVVCLVAIHLLWLRFLEASLPLWIATAIALALSYIIIRYG